MHLYVIEGPGDTRRLPLDTPDDEREFKAALNTQEALNWAVHYPETPQAKLSKTWLKHSYGTDKVPQVRKMLAKAHRPRKTWQENPLTYAVVILSLSIVGSLVTRYLNETYPNLLHHPVAVQQSVPAVSQKPADAPDSEATEPAKRHRIRILHWLHLRSD